WTIGADIAYYGVKNLVVGESSSSAAKTKSGEISIPPKFLIETEDKGSLKLVNNSASQSGLSVFNSSGIAAAFYANSNTYGTYFGNGGSGPAAYFGDKIQIVDGTQGAGKVLTSNADGAASWQEPAGSLWSESGSNIYFTGGNVGIGTASPSGQLNVYSESTLITGFNSGGGDNILDFGRPSQTNGAYMFFNTGSARKFYIAMVGNSDALRIFANSTTKGGLQIESNGNVTITTELNQTNTGNANMLPFAYGYVTNSGSLSSGTSNIGTVSRMSTGQYKIEIGGLGSDYVVQITGVGGSSFYLAKLMGLSTTYFTVSTWDTKSDGYADCAFTFVVYKL
ncbi:MAG: hypothetical protein JXR34_12360, partial [Bacteroidales bacterium]|nr:hypothetical protein [Bacteroidales bacterium]